MHFVTTRNKELIQPKRKRKETTRSVEARAGANKASRLDQQEEQVEPKEQMAILVEPVLALRTPALPPASYLCLTSPTFPVIAWDSHLQEWQTCLSHCSVSPLTCIATVFYLVSPLHRCLHDMFSKVQETFFFLNGKSDFAVSELNKESPP